jgi:hypothetical protein
MRQHLKDQWVTASEVRTYCSRAGGYAREVLQEAAKNGLVERKEEVNPQVYYKIDPPLGHSNPICLFEPHVPYEESVCVFLEKKIEDCVESRHRGGHSESCNLLDDSRGNAFSQLTYTSLMDYSELRRHFLRDPRDSFPHGDKSHINIQPSAVV